MIKKSGALLLTLLYIVTITGFALNFHYCFNQITSIKIDVPVKSCCLQTTGKMKCCHNKHFEVKVKDAHQGQSPSFLSKVLAFKVQKMHFGDFLLSEQQATTKANFGNAPPDPLLNSPDYSIKNCVFRI